MTGTAFSKGKIFMDFDSYKNQEWLRRRKLRLEQVRKQSNEIARALRQKVSDEEKKKLEEYKTFREEKFRIWKAEKLEELEKQLKCALERFGTGYRLAEEEPDPEVMLEEKNKVNLSKAQKRGEIAQQEELRKNKLAKENLMSSVERKKMSRKREDLRSILVCSVPIKKQEVHQETNPPGKHKITLIKKKIKRPSDKSNAPALQKKVPAKILKKKIQSKQKSCACKCQPAESEACLSKGVHTLWINLDEVQMSSASESGPLLRNSKSTICSKKDQKDKSEGSVEFYDFSSRYYCKSFKEFPYLVERVKYDSEELNANELAKIDEEEVERAEAKRKMEIDVVSQERGTEALRKEKVNRDYNNLIAKLEELSKKEKILKSQHRNPPSFLHMNDERLSERTKMKQRIMESKFESIYYEATAGMPPTRLPHSETIYNLSGGGDYFEPEQGPVARLSFSASNLKHNSPAASSGKSSSEAPPPENTQRPTSANSQKQLLININNALREGRELRKRISRNRKSESSAGEEEEEEKREVSSNSESESELISPGMTDRVLTKCRESQTEDLNGFEEGKDLHLRSSEKGGDDSLPVSTSTSYKSPPGVIRCHKLQEFLNYLEGLNETEENYLLRCSPKLKRKVKAILRDLVHENNSSKLEDNDGTLAAGSALRYYIEKLLNMSRECIANLSVSSENISTPNITDLDIRDEREAPDSECLFRSSSKGEDLIRKLRLEKANALEKSIRNWKTILEKKSKKSQPEPEDVPDCPQLKQAQCFSAREAEKHLDVACSPKIKSRYDEITKKCSERISELSGMLDKVRKDKKKLLSSASGGSSLNLSNGEGNSEKGFFAEEEGEEEFVHTRRSAGISKTSPALEGFVNRYNLTRPREETVSTTAVADSQSLQDLNESLESWPDVMDELLKREILTSPFKWSDGELSSELTTINDNWTKPSSIESVIGNFRKEIDKIKPFSLAEPRSNSPIKPRFSADGDHRELFSSPRRKTSCFGSDMEGNGVFKEESSVESINHYLTSLGLNWAKSFLRKNAESRAMNSSSNSEKKSSEDEDENYL